MKLKNNKILTIKDLSAQEIGSIFDEALIMKKGGKRNYQPLKNKSIGLIFQKPSNRTRVSFEVAIHQLGGHSIYLRPEDIQLGKRESVSDVARTLTRYLDGIVIRTFKHSDIEELAKNTTIPVINALSDMFHPCQVLADIFTVKERRTLESQKIVFVGDGNNVCHSWLYGAAKLQLYFIVACPKGHEPDPEVVKDALEIAGTKSDWIEVVHDPREAVEGATIIYTDVWVSMGDEADSDKKKDVFRSFQVNRELVSKAAKNALIMHCLPAHRGEEITDEIIDGPQSIVYDQAENRLHVQKALLGMLF